MGKITANTYINFHGRAREAMEFYHKIFGGKLDLLAFNESGAPKPAGPNDTIMHSYLEANGMVLMGTDGMPEYPPTVGDNMSVSLMGKDKEQLTKIFDQLSAGGQVKQPLKKESWGDTFGYFVDKFGINWMVDIAQG